jgi:hypothetical protein
MRTVQEGRHVGLQPGEGIPVSTLRSTTGRKLSKTFIPEGPMIVETPW